MNILLALVRRLGLTLHPLGGWSGEAAATTSESPVEKRDCWLLVQSGMPRY